MTAKISGAEFPISSVESPKKPRTTRSPSATSGSSFDEVLKAQLSRGLRFSAHAQNRLQLRGINLSPQDQENLSQAVSKAAQKGANDSLVLMRDLAFVVSVKNRTVITAVNGDSLKENIFTNIDSAVVI